MAAFDPTEHYSADYFTQNLISSKPFGKMASEPKVRKRGLGAWLNKLWRRLTRDDLHPMTVQSRMVRIAWGHLRNNDLQNCDLVRLSNLYCNIANFERSVIQKHNKKLFSYLFFWSRMPQPPKDLMAKLKGKIVEMLDQSCQNLPRQSVDQMGLKGCLDQIDELKTLLDCAENLHRISLLDANKVRALKTELASFLARASQQIKQEAQALKSQVDGNTWNERSEDKLRAFANADFSKINSWIDQYSETYPGVLQAGRDIADAGGIMATVRVKIAADTAAVEEATRLYQAKASQAARADLQNLQSPVTEERFNRLMNLTYADSAKKQILRNWKTLWETSIRNNLQEAKDLFDRMDRLKDILIPQLTAEDFNVNLSPMAIGGRLGAIYNQREAINTAINRVGPASLSRTLEAELKQAFQAISYQITQYQEMAEKKKISEVVRSQLYDSAALVQTLKQKFPREFDVAQPIAPQLRRLLQNPISQFLQGMRDSGRGSSAFAQSLTGPWEEIDRAMNNHRAYAAALEQILEPMRQITLKNSEPREAVRHIGRQVEQIITQYNGPQMERLALLSPEEALRTTGITRVYQDAAQVLLTLSAAYGSFERAVNECNANSFAECESILARHLSPDRTGEIRALLMNIALPLANQVRHPLFESAAYREAIVKLHEIDCIRKVIAIRNNHSAYMSAGSGNRFRTPEEYGNAVTILRESRELLAKLPADNATAMLLNNEVMQLDRVCQANAQSFPSLNIDADRIVSRMIEHINYQFKAAPARLFARNTQNRANPPEAPAQPQPIDQEVFQKLFNEPSISRAKKKELEQLKGLLGRLPGYVQSWEGKRTPGAMGGMTYEAPSNSREADEDMLLLAKLSSEGKLAEDVKRMVKMLREIYDLQLHPLQNCPITLMRFEEAAYIKSLINGREVNHYFDKKAIEQYIPPRRPGKHPLTNEQGITHDRIIPCPEATRLVADYLQWCKDHRIEVE